MLHYISLRSVVGGVCGNIMLVKICGVRTPGDAKLALDYGADLIGIILVPGRARTVQVETARAIAEVVHQRSRRNSTPCEIDGKSLLEKRSNVIKYICSSGPKLVGVFKDQPLEDIITLQQQIGLDFVQLHGKEPLEFCEYIPVPVIKRYTPSAPNFNQWSANNHWAVLIDGETGGDGKLVDWNQLKGIPESHGVYILGGGLTPENVASAASQEGVFCVDVSSGTETDGKKDEAKVAAFIKNAKDASRKHAP